MRPPVTVIQLVHFLFMFPEEILDSSIVTPEERYFAAVGGSDAGVRMKMHGIDQRGNSGLTSRLHAINRVAQNAQTPQPAKGG